MKKILTLCVLIVIVCSKGKGQTATATWPLISDANPTVSTNLTALPFAYGPSSASLGYTATGAASNDIPGSYPGSIFGSTSEYYQFAVSPTAGNALNISTFTFVTSSANNSTYDLDYDVEYLVSSTGTGTSNGFYSNSTFVTTLFMGGNVSNQNNTVNLNVTVPAGSTLYVRVYPYAGRSSTTIFSMKNASISGTVLVPPANDNCTGATALIINSTCTSVSGTTVRATQSQGAATCSGATGNADDDVWYKFIANNTTASVSVSSPSSSFDPVVQVFSGTCGNLTSLNCIDAGGSGASETLSLSGLTIGTTYYVRVYGYGAGTSTQGTFNICIIGTCQSPTAYSVTGGGAYCSGGTGVLVGLSSSQVGFSYQLYNGSTATGSAVTGTGSAISFGAQTIAGTYTVKAVNTGSAGCSSTMTGSATVTVTALPTASLSGTQTICNGSPAIMTLTFTGISPWTVKYTNGTNSGTASSTVSSGTISITPPATTTYTLQAYSVTDGSGCSSGATSGSATITVNQKSANPASATATSTTICSGSSTSLTLNGGGGGTGEVVKWYAGSCSGTPVGSGNGLSVSPTTTTTYYGRYEDGSPCNYNSGCASIMITVKQAPTASITPVSGSECAGTSVQVNITGTAGASVTYALNGNTQPSQLLPYPINSPTNAGTYTYTLQSVTTNGCTGTISNATAAITIKPNPTVTAIAGSDYIQTGTNIQLTNATSGGVWATNAAAIANIGSVSGSPVTVTGVGEGVSNISYTVTSNSCSTIVSKSVRVYNPDYITQANGDFSNAATWEIDRDDNTFVTSVPVPAGINYSSIRVQHALRLDQDFQVDAGKTFSLITGGTLTIAPNTAFSSQGTADFGGKRVLVQSNPAGTGAIGIVSTPIANATNVQAERYTDAALQVAPATSRRAWRLMTSPVTGQTIHQAWQENAASNTDPNPGYGTIITGYNMPDAGTASGLGYDFTGAGLNSSIRRYDAATDTYISIPTTLTSIQTEPAYLVFIRGNRLQFANGAVSIANLRATGTLQQGTKSVNYAANTPKVLVGNPYASTINFGQLIQHNPSIKDQFILWNSNYGVYGAYVTVTHDGTYGYKATPSPLAGVGVQDDDNYKYIPSGTGFLVVPVNTSAGSISFQETDKTPGNKPPASPFRVVNTPTNLRQIIVNLNLRDTDTTTTLADGFRAKFSTDYEGNEADNSSVKLSNLYENLGLVRENDNLIIEARGEVKKTDTLYMKMWNVVKRRYQFQVRGDNFASVPGIRAWLEDSYLATKQELALDGSVVAINFEVNSDAGSIKSDRFRIVFENNTVTLSVTITKITAQPKNGGAEVVWTVANETNIKDYIVEKSTDGGRTFTPVGTQQPARNNPQAAVTSYSGYDAQPKLGDNYYRIRIEARDGTVSYSTVVKVIIGQGGTGIQITLYPNPVREGKVNLKLTNLKEGAYLVNVYSGSGQTVYQKKLYVTSANGTQTEPLLLGNTLAQGSYQIKVADSKGTVIFNDQLIVGR